MTPDAEARVDVGEPFDLRGTVRPWTMTVPDRSMRVDRDVVAKAARMKSGPTTISFEASAGTVAVRAWGPGAVEAISDAPAMLGADDRPEEFTPDHPELAKLARRHRGIRMGRAPSMMEVLIAAVLGQRVTTKEAKQALRGLGHTFGGPAPGPFELTLPPAPDALAGLPYYEYHRFSVERRRADILRYVCKRPKRIAALRDLPLEEAKGRLSSVRGIGPWTTGLVAATALGDPDAVILGDYHLPNLVAWALAGEPRADDARMLELLAPFEGHRYRALRLIYLSGVSPPRFGPRRGPAHWMEPDS